MCVRRRLQAALEDLRQGESKDTIVTPYLKNSDIRTGIRELDVALQSFDEARKIFTIHGFCQRMLERLCLREWGALRHGPGHGSKAASFQEIARDYRRLRFYRAKPLLPLLAMAWKKSPMNWVELLARTRSHPLTLSFCLRLRSQVVREVLHDVELAFAAVRKNGRSHRAEISFFAGAHGGLSAHRTTSVRRESRKLIARVTDACEEVEFADSESIGALAEVCSEAIAAGTKATGTAPVHQFFTCSAQSSKKKTAHT